MTTARHILNKSPSQNRCTDIYKTLSNCTCILDSGKGVTYAQIDQTAMEWIYQKEPHEADLI